MVLSQGSIAAMKIKSEKMITFYWFFSVDNVIVLTILLLVILVATSGAYFYPTKGTLYKLYTWKVLRNQLQLSRTHKISTLIGPGHLTALPTITHLL